MIARITAANATAPRRAAARRPRRPRLRRPNPEPADFPRSRRRAARRRSLRAARRRPSARPRRTRLGADRHGGRRRRLGAGDRRPNPSARATTRLTASHRLSGCGATPMPAECQPAAVCWSRRPNGTRPADGAQVVGCAARRRRRRGRVLRRLRRRRLLAREPGHDRDRGLVGDPRSASRSGSGRVGRVTRGAVVPGALLALFAAWSLASAAWSSSAEDAFAEFDRVVLYLGVYVLVVLAADRAPPRRLARRPRGRDRGDRPRGADQPPLPRLVPGPRRRRAPAQRERTR